MWPIHWPIEQATQLPRFSLARIGNLKRKSLRDGGLPILAKGCEGMACIKESKPISPGVPHEQERPDEAAQHGDH